MLAHLTALILTSATPAASAVPCALHHLDACQNTYQLRRTDAFGDALKAFVGNHQAGWLYGDATEITQIFHVLGGPPDPKEEVPSNLLRFSACRAHSCDEKGAVFLTSDGSIKSVAILHFSCARTCSDTYTLTVLVHEKSGHLVDLAKNWAAETLNAHDEQYPDYPLPRWSNVEILMRP